VWERCKLDISFGECYLNVRPLGAYYGALNYYMIYLAIVFSFVSLIPEGQVGTSVMVWIVLKVGKLVACWEGSWLVRGGGGGLFGSVFVWHICMLAVGYVICRVDEGLVIAGCGLWV
jgi:hypothetical protein